MARLRPGWLVTLCAAILAVSVWLPWLTTSALGGGRANAIGGTVGSLQLSRGFGAGQLIVLLTSTLLVAGAMTARGLSARMASIGALVISLLIAVLTGWYFHLYVSPPVSASYGFYLGASGAAGAILCSLWALIDALISERRR
ncbi:hypothetical protein [Mycolicibacterium komossense]|uniref:Transmembrane protein n=1 Tax=Mycolicibacterium komossense TaxID=1779 RepID=A0ABT3CE74_9MYCO|nr:hypothetical protein [Mycolicibacterium komossense]MCV7227673.1 hypothetical protein [Mycolicibacterium komossense]